jgi:hypothetical protein
VRRADNLTTLCADCLEIWELQPLGTLGACTGIVLPLPLLVFSVSHAMNVGPCHHGMARPQVADGGTASYVEGSCE